MDRPTAESVWKEYMAGVSYNDSLDLYDTVQRNENFFIGKQWEGVQSNGLPTPVLNIIKRITLFQVASTATDNLKVNLSPLNVGARPAEEMEQICDILSSQFDAIMEDTKFGHINRGWMKDAAVDGDGCMYSWFDPDAETGQDVKGTIKNELLDNRRVIFGDRTSRDVQSQPYIIVMRRELLRDVKEEAKANGKDPDSVQAENDDHDMEPGEESDNLVTTLTRMYKDGGSVWFVKSVKDTIIRDPWNTGLKRYPIAWFSWERIKGSYHGQALTTELIPMQEWVNKAFAMVMIKMVISGFGKPIYDKTRIPCWDANIGTAIAVNGSVQDVATNWAPPPFDSQLLNVIQMGIDLTKELCGATDAALGSSNIDNATVVLAQQKATQVPMELVKQDMHDAVENGALNWLDIMRCCYGERLVTVPLAEEDRQQYAMAGIKAPDTKTVLFDFGVLEDLPLSIKLDVGGSAYWSEIAQLNTLDNLLMNSQIDVTEYLERLPEGYVANKQELIDSIKDRMMGQQMPGMGVDTPMAQDMMGIDPTLARGEATMENMALKL